MATELLTHAKTGVIQMGWPKLYEAVAFKGNKDDDKSAKKDDKKKRPFAVWCGWVCQVVTVLRSSLPQVR